MRKPAVACVLALMALTACKPTEQNYREAYERTMAGRADAAEDSTIYTQMRRNLKMADLVVDGDSIGIVSQFVAITEGGGGINEYIRRYCVVAGQFKQVFNAKSMRERLVENGYPGAFVVQNSEPYYYVIAGSFAEAQQAMALAEALRHDQALRLRAPLPYILRPAQLSP